MQPDNIDTTEIDASHKEATETKQYLIHDSKYQLLQKCQKEVFDATESSPAIRKIINELITEENLSKVKEKFINVWSN